jgi:hypothetical protein
MALLHSSLFKSDQIGCGGFIGKVTNILHKPRSNEGRKR